jgi:hypothetical protein
MNGWKWGFFGMLLLWLTTVVAGLYSTLDSGVSQTHGAEGRADCEVHRDFLHTLMRNRITREDIRTAHVKVTRAVEEHSHDVGAEDFELKYDKQGRYLGSRYGASNTPGFE